MSRAARATQRVPRWGRALLVAAAIAVAWLVGGLYGTSGTLAAWSSTITIPGSTLRTGSTGLTVSAPASATLSGSNTSTVTSVTIKNTGTAPLRSFSTQTAISGSSLLAENVQLAIWPLTTGACSTTAPAGAASGTWAAVPNWLAGQGTLAAGSTATYCLLSSMTTAALIQFGGLTETPTLQISGATGASGGGWTTGWQSAAPFTLTTAAAANPFTWNPEVNVTYDVYTDSTGALCYDVTISSKGTNNQNWTLTVNTTVAPFKGVPFTSWTWPDGDQVKLDSSTSTSINLVGIGGTKHDTNGNNKTVSPGVDVPLNFCVGGN